MIMTILNLEDIYVQPCNHNRDSVCWRVISKKRNLSDISSDRKSRGTREIGSFSGRYQSFHDHCHHPNIINILMILNMNPQSHHIPGPPDI